MKSSHRSSRPRRRRTKHHYAVFPSSFMDSVFPFLTALSGLATTVEARARSAQLLSQTLVEDKLFARSPFTVLSIRDPWPAPPPDALSELLIEATKLMPKIEFLSICRFVLKRPYHLELLKLSFPFLLACDVGPPSLLDDHTGTRGADLIVSFLALHPTLTRIRVPSSNRVIASPSVRVFLPNLQDYNGPAGLIPALVVRGLKRAKLMWHTGETSGTDIHNIIRALNLLSTPEIPFFSSHEYCDDCCMPIVTAVSTHMPHTRALQMWSMVEFDKILDEETIRHITNCLPHFTGLTYLAIEWCIGIFRTPSADEDADRMAVEAWGDACPTLEACCLNDYAWRKVDGRWEEYPMSEFRAQAGIPAPGSKAWLDD
ncbi:hypothetical protein FB451DRAFT_281580 [Mycena latifolia]|nr:hypothetical protein FB451DRAFT_281580 [Mycena latifolia]